MERISTGSNEFMATGNGLGRVELETDGVRFFSSPPLQLGVSSATEPSQPVEDHVLCREVIVNCYHFQRFRRLHGGSLHHDFKLLTKCAGILKDFLIPFYRLLVSKVLDFVFFLAHSLRNR